MVIVNEQVVTLPEASVAVYVTVVVPAGKNVPGTCEDTTVMPPQLSVKVGGVQVTERPHVLN